MNKPIYRYTFLLLTLIATVMQLAAQGIPSNVPRRGLVAYYGFNGNADDLTGNGNHGVLQCDDTATVPVLAADRYGNAESAFEFGGVHNRNWIRVEPSASLSFQRQMTISFWMQQSSAEGAVITGGTEQIVSSNAYFTVIAKGGAREVSGVSSGFRIRSSFSDTWKQTIDFYNANPSAGHHVGITADLNCYALSEWIHCVVIVSGSTQILYINGTLYERGNMTDTNTSMADFGIANDLPLYFGRLDGGAATYFPFSGRLDDIAIYNRAISYLEVDSLYNSYRDPAAREIELDSAVVVNPCGSEYGRVYLYPHPVDGANYQYGISRLANLQRENELRVHPGEYRCYISSRCRVWDTVISLTCDCTPPTRTFYESICPGDTGSTGEVSVLYNYKFEEWEEWQHDGYWRLSPYDDNGYSWNRRIHSYDGLSAMCPTYWGEFAYSSSNLISPPITITSDLIRTAVQFVYTALTLVVDNRSEWQTLTLSYSTSPEGPWISLWNSWEGGENDDSVYLWNRVTVSLSSLPGEGVYYFRFDNTGMGYITGIDNFQVVTDSRWAIPEQATNGTPGTTVSVTNYVDNNGMCPVNDLTYWFIKDTTRSDTFALSHTPFEWYGITRATSGTYSYNHNDSLKNAAGCDSTIYLHLTVDPNNRATIYREACDSIVIDNRYFDHSVIDSVTCRHCNQYGGDSTTLYHIVIHHSADLNPRIVAQPSVLDAANLNLQLFDASGTSTGRSWYINGQHLATMGSTVSYSADLEEDTVVVVMTVSDGFCRDTAVLLVPVLNNALYVPNILLARSPLNADQPQDANGRLWVRGSGITDYEISIYNRYGHRVYHSSDINDAWDGTHNGSPCPQGSYTYLVRYKDVAVADNWRMLRGTVTLIR